MTVKLVVSDHNPHWTDRGKVLDADLRAGWSQTSYNYRDNVLLYVSTCIYGESAVPSVEHSDRQ